MNPLAIMILLIVAAAGGYFGGHHVGENDQKVADQAQFDGINQKLTDQKTEAAGVLKTKNAENLALMVERDTLKTTLEKTREDNRQATAAARDRYAGIRLRFQPAQTAGCRIGGAGAEGSGADPASASAAAAVELPAAVTDDLRRLAYDADTLADSYRECYGYAQQVR